MSDNIPAGLEDFNIEAYRKGNDVHAIYGGARMKWNDLPAECREPFAVELINDKKALHCLKADMHIDDIRLEEQFVWCRYGQFNNVPDLDMASGKTQPDAPGCDNEATCKGLGIVCLIPGGLSRQEYFIVRLIVKGKLDKEIADEFKISITTVRTHVQRIHAKLNV